jgi:hypothetical protein
VRQSRRKLHLGLDADTGQIVAATLTGNEGDDGLPVGPLLDQVAGGLLASFTGAGAYKLDNVFAAVVQGNPNMAIWCQRWPSVALWR